ncbi:hypothetical protein ACP8Y2_02840 [Herpetosiphon llansteffanensis]
MPTSQPNPPTIAAAPAAANPAVAPLAANISFETAAPLVGQINASSSESNRYYWLDVPIGGVVTSTITVEPQSPKHLTVTLYDHDHNYLKAIKVYPGRSEIFVYTFGMPEGGQVVWEFHGNALFSLSAIAADQYDGTVTGDAGAELAEASTLTFAPNVRQIGTHELTNYAISIAGTLGDIDTTDYFRLDMPPTTGILTLKAQSSHALQLQLFDAAQKPLAMNTSANNPLLTYSWILHETQAGPLFLRVDETEGYVVFADFEAQNDAESAGDAGDEFDLATSLDKRTMTGLLSGDDRNDYLRVPASLGRTISVWMLNDSFIDIQLYDQDRNAVEQIYAIAPGSHGVLHAPEDSGDYFIHVSNGSIPANYRIDIHP